MNKQDALDRLSEILTEMGKLQKPAAPTNLAVALKFKQSRKQKKSAKSKYCVKKVISNHEQLSLCQKIRSMQT